MVTIGRDKLMFPKLKFVREDKEIRNDKEKIVNIFRLDWSNVDDYKHKKFYSWLVDREKEKIIKDCLTIEEKNYIQDLPDEYEKLLEETEFCLNNEYIKEIHHCSDNAVIEWSKERYFDTCVREYCLKPAESFVDVAFYLLSDCIWDKNKRYYIDYTDKEIIRSLMLYKFWNRQTGIGLVWGKSFKKLEDRFNYQKNDLKIDTYNKYNNVIINMKKYQDEKEKWYDENIGMNVDYPKVRYKVKNKLDKKIIGLRKRKDL